GPAEAVISYRFWQNVWSGSDDVLGKHINYAGKSYRIVGVMPRGFFFKLDNVNAWLPFVMTPKHAKDPNPRYRVVVRRKPGVSPSQLNLELKQAQARMASGWSAKQRTAFTRDGYVLDARSLHSVEIKLSPVGDLPWLLQATAGLLLLLALA